MRKSKLCTVLCAAGFAMAALPIAAEGEQGLLSEMYSFSDTFTTESMADLGGQETTAGTILLKGNEETDCLFCLQPDVGTTIGAIYENTGKQAEASLASVIYAWHEDTAENGVTNARYVGAQFALWARMKSLDRSVLEGLTPGTANQSLAYEAREYALQYYDRSLQLEEAAAALNGTAYELSSAEWTIEDGQESRLFTLDPYAKELDALLKNVTYTVTADDGIEIRDENGQSRTEFKIEEPFAVGVPQQDNAKEYRVTVTVQADSAASTEIWESKGYQSFAMYAEKALVQDPQILTVRFEKKETPGGAGTGPIVPIAAGAAVVLALVVFMKRRK